MNLRFAVLMIASRNNSVFTQGGVGEVISCRIHVRGFRGGIIIAQSPCLVRVTNSKVQQTRCVQVIPLRSVPRSNKYHHQIVTTSRKKPRGPNLEMD